MTASEPGNDVSGRPESDTGAHRDVGPWGTGAEAAGTDHRARSHTAKAAETAQPIGGRPILWRWWLLAAVISLGLWGGIAALVR